VKIVNLTPHPLHIRRADGSTLHVHAWWKTHWARIEERHAGYEPSFEGLMILQLYFGKAVNIPKPQEGTVYIVRLITALEGGEELRKRDDIFVPGREIRDEQGRIIACDGLRKLIEV
jgi:hypothetical protein